MRAGSWKLTPYQAWLEGLLQALSLSLGAAFSFHEHCLDRWNHLHLRIPTPWVSKDMNWCHRNNWGFGEPCFVWEAPNESSSRLMVGSVVPRKDFAIPISTQPSHDSNSTLYMRLANQPRFKINFLKIAWNKKNMCHKPWNGWVLGPKFQDTPKERKTTDQVSVELMSNDVLLILFSPNSWGLLGNVLSLYEIQIWTSSLVTYHLRHLRHLGKSPIGTLQWSNVASWKSIHL